MTCTSIPRRARKRASQNPSRPASWVSITRAIFRPADAHLAFAAGLVSAVVDGAELPGTVRSMVAHLAADPALARALAADLHRTVHDPGAWDRAVEIERARQMWSLARDPKES